MGVWMSLAYDTGRTSTVHYRYLIFEILLSSVDQYETWKIGPVRVWNEVL